MLCSYLLELLGILWAIASLLGSDLALSDSGSRPAVLANSAAAMSWRTWRFSTRILASTVDLVPDRADHDRDVVGVQGHVPLLDPDGREGLHRAEVLGEPTATMIRARSLGRR